MPEIMFFLRKAFGISGSEVAPDDLRPALASSPFNLHVTTLKLSFSAINITQYDNCKLVLVLFNGLSTEEIGRTEVIADSSYPELSWPVSIHVEYRFGACQSMIIRVYNVHPEFDDRHESLQLQNQKLLAESRCHLSQIVTAKNRTFTFAFQKDEMSWQGELSVRAEETDASSVIALNVKYSPNHRMMRRRDSGREGRFLKLSKVVNNMPNFICTTEVVKSDLNSKWSLILPRQLINEDGKLIIEGLIFSSDGKHTNFGDWKALVSDLKSGKKKVDNNSLSVDISPSNTFLDNFKYYKLCFMVAVEFSATNGHPEILNDSQHLDASSKFIRLLQVIKNVGKALELYDSYRRFAAWGFGGNTSMNGKVSSCFNLNLNPNNCEVNNKVDGIIDAYKTSLKEVKLDGDDPASLSKVIKNASDFVENSCRHHCHKYYIFLIIMDGGFYDIGRAIDSLVDASKQPLSIIIVGMDDSTSFNDLMKRCARKGHQLEKSKGGMAVRDTVLCMPISQLPTDEQCMAETLLEGIPKQFCEYMQKEGIKLG